MRTLEQIERDIAAQREWDAKFKNPDTKLRAAMEMQAKRWGISYDEFRAYMMKCAKEKYGDGFYDEPASTSD